VLTQHLRDAGYEVIIRPSPWHLGPGSEQLQRQLINGWCEAALEVAPDSKATIESWQQQRLQDADKRDSAISVGHQDLLALPPWSAR
jgi:hypothetical protein